jgi:endogenous inhibitor of DNA gyrase (YacG/DUF329 family)
MTAAQRQQVEYLRAKGGSYAFIAGELGLSVNTVKSCCRRAAGHTGSCGHCGAALTPTPGRKARRFCSQRCRAAWWAAHPECLNRKAVYTFACAACGASFTAYGNRGRKYCSHACYTAARYGKAAPV